jgi:hypothetical protein
MTKFRCWIPDNGGREDGKDIEAYDASGAAVMFMEHYEARNFEYTVASGGEETVAVAEGDGETEMYTVWGEARPAYYARIAQPSKGGDHAD